MLRDANGTSTVTILGIGHRLFRLSVGRQVRATGGLQVLRLTCRGVIGDLHA